MTGLPCARNLALGRRWGPPISPAGRFSSECWPPRARASETSTPRAARPRGGALPAPPIVVQLGLVARPCPRHGPQSLADGFRPLAQTRQRSPEGLKPRSTARSGPMSRPTPGAALDHPQALRRRQELAPGKAGRYHGGNCPGCGSAPIEACRKADGLRFVLDVT